MNHALVITTINSPSCAVEALASGCRQNGWKFYVAGDTKTPDDAYEDDEKFIYLSHARQKQSSFKLSHVLPDRTYARKMFGYLAAAQDGATVIVETDDDNAPLENFFVPRNTGIFQRAAVSSHLTLSECGWVNIYRHFAPYANLWPRGFPLSEIKTPLRLSALSRKSANSLVYQGLANGAPDIDAIHRLVYPNQEFIFECNEPLQLIEGAYCPFNSQNTTWYQEAFPLLYLPATCSFRMTDIYRSYVAQRILHQMGRGIVFHNATVHQDRNEHSIIGDFRDEAENYKDDGQLMASLNQIDLSGLSVPEMIRSSYQTLQDEGYVEESELPMLDAWLVDIQAIEESR